MFTSQNTIYKEQKDVIFPSGFSIFGRFLLFFLLYLKMRFTREYLRVLLLIKSSDIEINPCPKKQSWLNFFHWNLNVLAARDFINLPLIKAGVATNNFDIVCLSKTFLDSSISNDNNKINIPEYSLIRADHPSNTKKEGVSIYYKNFSALIKKDHITDLKKRLVTEITVDNEKCFLRAFIGH